MNNVYDSSQNIQRKPLPKPRGIILRRNPMGLWENAYDKARKECIFNNLAFLCVNTWRTLREIYFIKSLKINIIRILISYNKFKLSNCCQLMFF